MKRHLAALAAATLALLPTAVASAEHLVMPFACRMERGRVTLTPSPERSYPILGTRSERPFTWCESGPCRIRMVHRFELNCGGTRVAWVAVAGAVRARTQGAVDGRSTPARADAAFGSLPQGFAPLIEAGARISQQPLKPAVAATAAPAAAPAPLPPANADRSVEQSPLDPPDLGGSSTASPPAAPSPDLPPPADAAAAIVAADPVAIILASSERALKQAPAPRLPLPAWTVTVVESAEAAEPEAAADGGAAGHVILVLLLGTVLAGVGWQRQKRLRSAATSSIGVAAGRGVARRPGSALFIDQDERACLDLARTVEQLMRNADERLAELNTAAPLRGVLRQELDVIKQRLAESLKLAERPKPSWRLLRTRLQSAVRELHRIVRIAEGGIASFTSAHAAFEAPKSREEAYEILGVNADVSDAVLKKVVDGLRMTWHPDLAKSEDDRLRREERTKVINVAWDLVSGKRAEA